MSINKIKDTFQRMYRNSTYRLWLWVLGFFTVLVTFIKYKGQKGKDKFASIKADIRKELEATTLQDELYQTALVQVRKKNEYFNKTVSDAEVEKQAKEIAAKNFETILQDKAKIAAEMQGVREVTMASCFADLIDNKAFLLVSLVLSFPMYIVMVLFQNPISKYATDRIVMMVFVLFGVVWLVFTILYISPMDPALNILGQTATQEQVDQFNRVYGLDQPYLTQLFAQFKNLITFNMGNSYQGNEPIMTALMNKFPITLQVTFWSMLVSLGIAIPAGIISAIKQYTSFDYIAMFFALLGLSIPNFWLGLMLILYFSINLGILPATYQVGNGMTLIMPAIVLGTGMSASVARMTRSSMLEVKNSDYILTARAKGLPENKVVMKHILGNAMIPIITTIGAQFGGMLGGSSVTEKVFNINGIGSFIVERQYIPDIPVVLAGVVYISFVVSIMNLVVDIMYAVIDPRIKSRMKNY
ncbi:MAG: ABC transporter permease subunit [Oscillospiraceae bacterium]|nr:ABC transporter permease subunit [Oscillospiraceae bacterium]